MEMVALMVVAPEVYLLQEVLVLVDLQEVVEVHQIFVLAVLHLQIVV